MKDVVDLDVFLRGARLARDPLNTAGIPGLTEVEKVALESESKSGLFQLTKDLKVTILQSSINASSPGWQNEFRPDEDPSYWDNRKLLAGLIDAAPWLSGSLIGTWLSDPLQEGRFGRRPALLISGILCTAFVLGTSRCTTWQQLLVCRLLLGIGVGAKASIAPVFAAEAAIDHLRGRLLMMWQLFDTFGIFLGFACVFIVDLEWRIILGTAAIPSIVMMVIACLCPESPRFLIRKKRYGDALLSLRHLRGSDIQACRDLYYIHSQLQYESQKRLQVSGERLAGVQQQQLSRLEQESWVKEEVYQEIELPRLNFSKRVWKLWSIKRNRRACIAAFIVMASQQLCGVNILSFYSSSLYEDATENGTDERRDPRDTQVAWLNFGFGLANFLFTIPAYWFIDGYYHRGRRLLLLVSLGGIFFTLISIGSFYFLDDGSPKVGLVATFTIVIYLAFYGIGAGPVPFTFSAEVFPLAFREVGMSFSVMVNFVGLGLLVNFVPAITDEFEKMKVQGHVCLLYIFAGLDLVAFVLVFLFVPSTGRRSLEDMNAVFDIKMSDHVRTHLAFLPCIPIDRGGRQDELEFTIVNGTGDTALNHDTSRDYNDV
ncbi:major facilitator superfamily domain-containing protein [Aspergillus stella-maris]|uniref:major facilitator superfamily domain-containing protein n=1 Tax=Aspergillus stella-maris TaxID=1810926 RepID=UPI003CCD423F